MKDMMIGVDLAKNVFQVHGALRTGEVHFRKKLTRKQFLTFMAKQEPCLVIFEACGSAHYWAREMETLGHEVKLIAPQYARPFVKRQKNDAADAEAIVIAARQPEMRFVEPKTVQQQSRAAIFRGRERLVHQRTADVNALRALLYEHGHVFPQGIRRLNRITALLEDKTADLQPLIREECLDLLAQIEEKTARIIELNQTGFSGEQKARKVSYDQRKPRKPFFDRGTCARGAHGSGERSGLQIAVAGSGLHR